MPLLVGSINDGVNSNLAKSSSTSPFIGSDVVDVVGVTGMVVDSSVPPIYPTKSSIFSRYVC